MIERIDVSWPYVRSVVWCPICRSDKSLGKITCEMCRTTRTLPSMTHLLDCSERSLQWNAERNPDRPAPKRATDPALAPCPNCGGTDLTFVRFETPGKIVGNRITANLNHYVRCNNCLMQTIPRPSKKLAAKMWASDRDWVFIPEVNAPDGKDW